MKVSSAITEENVLSWGRTLEIGHNDFKALFQEENGSKIFNFEFKHTKFEPLKSYETCLCKSRCDIVTLLP